MPADRPPCVLAGRWLLESWATGTGAPCADSDGKGKLRPRDACAALFLAFQQRVALWGGDRWRGRQPSWQLPSTRFSNNNRVSLTDQNNSFDTGYGLVQTGPGTGMVLKSLAELGPAPTLQHTTRWTMAACCCDSG